MIPYFDGLLQEEKEELTAAIRLIERQTYVLERKYDRKTGRFQYEKEYRVLERHMEFLREYLEISGIDVCEDMQLGVIYIRGEAVMAEKLSRLATLYLLLLKVIYDEQMAEASNELSVRITLGELNERLGAFRLAERTAPTEVKRALSLLKKYQILEPLDPADELDGGMRLIIYPTVSLVLTGNDMRELLEELGDREREKEPERTGEEAEAGEGTGEEAETGEEASEEAEAGEETGEEAETGEEPEAAEGTGEEPEAREGTGEETSEEAEAGEEAGEEAETGEETGEEAEAGEEPEAAEGTGEGTGEEPEAAEEIRAEEESSK